MTDLVLTDEQGRPLRLYRMDGRPATDRHGCVLYNICGTPLATVALRDEVRTFLDVKGCPLLDREGRCQEDAGFDPCDAPPEPEPRRICPGQVYATDGHPLTDPVGVPHLNDQGRPLVAFNPKGRPVTDLEGREVTDSTGVVLSPQERPYLSKDRQPLRIFDELGRPLTDENGFPLTNILGTSLIVCDEYRNPVATLNGYPLKDAQGSMPWDEGFDLTKTPKYNVIHKAIVCKNKENGIAFDSSGHPLTDMYGFPLFNIQGFALVKKSKKIWVGINKEPAIVIEKNLYDKDAIRYLRNSRGTPVRLYDKRGYPLTDHKGMPLINAQGILLLRFNEHGEPICDCWGDPIFDSRGNPLGSSSFRPCKDFELNPARDKALKFQRINEQFYDVHGMPLTNHEGIPLVNAYQELMVKYDSSFKLKQDSYGRDMYDILGLPVCYNFKKPLKGPAGVPIRLYNKLGKPLTDKEGNVLTTVNGISLLKTNTVGRICSDSKGVPFHDADGCPMSLSKQFFPTKMPAHEVLVKSLRNLDSSPLVLFDMSGEPLTDSAGRILFDNSGVPLITISPFGLIQERNGEFILDSDGYTKYKVGGRALTEKIAIYDIHDRPLIGPSGYILRLRTGTEIVKFDMCGFPVSTLGGDKVYDSQRRPIFTPLSDMYVFPTFEKIIVYDGELQLFDSEDRPLLDISGEVLFTSTGVSLVKLSDGMVTSDALGRPVYDLNGIPVCNPGGTWRDAGGRPFRLFDNDCYPVTDARGKELVDIAGRSLLRRNRYGHPMFDLGGNVVCDVEGRHMTSPGFTGTASPPQRKTGSIMESKVVPLRLYDKVGRPLTDECGKPLETSNGKPILDLTKGMNRITDMNGLPVYDQRGLPVGCNKSSPILTAEGRPIILYNKDGNPLMTMEGIPIKRVDGSTLLDFDQFGRPIYTDDSGLYDLKGKPVGSADCVLAPDHGCAAPLMSLEGKPVKVYDSSGLPLTDDKGNVLLRSDGEPLKAGSWGDNLG